MIWSLQILRFIAAALVVYMHASQYARLATGSHGTIPPNITAIGTVGVDIFFVLSGVVIAKTAPGLTPINFAWRRIRRIMPIYLVCSIPAFLIAFPHGITWRELLASLLLWPATDVMTQPLLPVAWTLCFEMLFYVAAAISLIDRRLMYALLTLYVAAFALRPYGAFFQFVGNPLVIEFLMGVVIAGAPRNRYGILAVPLGFLGLIAASFWATPPSVEPLDFLTGAQSDERLLAFGMPAALIVYGTMHIKARPSVWTDLGDASYSIYLVHLTVLTALLALWRHVEATNAVITFVGMVASLIVAWYVHDLVERPLLRALPKALDRRRA